MLPVHHLGGGRSSTSGDAGLRPWQGSDNDIDVDESPTQPGAPRIGPEG